jgi:hypothetical protein
LTPGWYINTKDPVYEAAWKRFYVGKPRPTEGNGWLRGSQLVLMTSTGRLLAGSMKYGDRNSLAFALREVLDAYRKLPEEERRAKMVEGEVKPVPAPPAGGLVLTIYDRPIARGPGSAYRLPEGKDLGGARSEAPHGQRSSLWLTKEECGSLIPEEPRQGETHAVPAQLAKRIALYGLVPQSLWVVTHTWQPDSLRAGELKLTVTESSPQTLRLRLHGSVLLTARTPHILYPTGKSVKEVENRYDARLEGVLVYDRSQKRISKWDMTALGDFQGTWFTGHDGWKEATAEEPLPLGFAFEIDESAYQLPPERRRPRSFIHAYIFHDQEQFYWDPAKWEEDWKRRQRR